MSGIYSILLKVNTMRHLQKAAHLLNFYLLQWFFLRLGDQHRQVIRQVKPHSLEFVNGSSISVAHTITCCTKEKRLFIWVGAYPLSGYDTRDWKYTRWAFAIPLGRWKKVIDYYEQLP